MTEREKRLSRQAFERLLDVHGADLAHWPPDVRAAAQALLQEDSQARALLDEARALEALLAADAPPPPAAGLQQRIMAAAGISGGQAARPARKAANDNHLPWWAAMPLAASLLLGVWLGFSGALSPVEQVLLAAAGDDVEAIVQIAGPVEDTEGDLL